MAESNQKANDYIEDVVRAFYDKATKDFLIGYQFRKIALAEGDVHPLQPPLDAFAHHLPRINDFWKNQLLGTPLPDKSDPFSLISIHKKLRVRKGEVNRWVLLFNETLNEQPEHALTEIWREKVKHFQEVFLRNKILFS